MYMHEYHPEQEKVLLLLHPMLASAEALYKLLGSFFPSFRLLIPDLAAHGEASSQPYKSAAAEAEAIHHYLQDNGISQVSLAFGASLGGVVLMELLSRPGIQYGHVCFEGTSLLENANFICKTAARVVLNKHQRAVADPALAAEKMGELFGTEQADTLAQRFIAITEESIRNAAEDCTHVHLPKLSAAQQNCFTFAFGAKDPALKPARKALPRHYPKSELIIWPGDGHCQHMTRDPAAYAAYLQQYLR